MVDFEAAATGGLTGLMGTVLVALGITQRVGRLEDGKLDKTEFKQFEKRFETLQKAIEELPDRVNEKVNGLWDHKTERRHG